MALVRCRSEEHTSELQSRFDIVCRLLLEEKKHDIQSVFYLFVLIRPTTPTMTLLPYTTLFRSQNRNLATNSKEKNCLWMVHSSLSQSLSRVRALPARIM